jgi:hypothetical protein
MKVKMDNFKIYQIFFRDDQIATLNPFFVPYDNRINLYPNEREYPILKQCYQRSLGDGVDFWGAVSWNFHLKFGDSTCRTEMLHNHIRNNPGYDVYFFNPETSAVAVSWNVWEQGQWCHPHMISIIQELFPLLGLPAEDYKRPQGFHNMFFGSMCIASNKFWEEYFAFADRYVNSISKLSPAVRVLHDGSAGYKDPTINYFSFIQERLMSWFVAGSQYRVLPFHNGMEKLPQDCFVLEDLKSQRRIREYCELRSHLKPYIYPKNDIDWAHRWCS